MRPPLLSLLSVRTRSGIRLVHTNIPDRFKYTPGANAIVMFFGRRVFLWALTGSAAIGLLSVRMEEKERQEKMGLRIMQLKDRVRQLEMSLYPATTTTDGNSEPEHAVNTGQVALTAPTQSEKTTQPSIFI
ncbi:hypothetical protein BDF22DRAFT_742063 [Syncephalis plumigaleata]|nr:hypothetical protein BDF22DRAFT_742063 [Syncephalis plumigaleata]